MKRFYLFLFTTITFFASTQLHCAALDRKVELKDEKEGKEEKDDKKEIQQTRTLNLSHFTITDDKEPIYDEAKKIVSLAYICNQKDITNLKSFSGINTIHQLKAIIDSLPLLQDLSLSLENKIIDKALIVIANHANLKSIIFNHFTKVSDNGIKFLSKCKKLETLKILDCTLLTNKALTMFSEYPNLKKLRLDNLTHKVTNEGINTLSKCKKLEDLGFTQYVLLIQSLKPLLLFLNTQPLKNLHFGD